MHDGLSRDASLLFTRCLSESGWFAEQAGDDHHYATPLRVDLAVVSDRVHAVAAVAVDTYFSSRRHVLHLICCVFTV